jgi:hypothetical protein
MKTKFEEHNFKCITPVGFYNLEHGAIHVQSKSDLVTAYENLSFVDGNGKDACFVKQWLKDKEMREYKYVQCLPPPLQCPSHTYNVWDGFAVDKVEPDGETHEEELQLLLNHIRLLCNNEEESYQFVLKWLASLFQKPAFKNNVALLFKSQQGLGKDLFHTMLERMIGATYAGNTSRPERDIFGDFNAFLHNSCS